MSGNLLKTPRMFLLKWVSPILSTINEHLGSLFISLGKATYPREGKLNLNHQYVAKYWPYVTSSLWRVIRTDLSTDLLICHHHHYHVMLVARISLTLSCHFSLSFIASGRSSGLHTVSSQELLNVCSCWSSCLWGSIGVHHLWARPCFSRDKLRVWFV